MARPGKTLQIWLGPEPVGVLGEDGSGALTFTYNEAYLARAGARAVSLAMPLQATPYDRRAVDVFFGGYLPESPEDLDRIADRFDVSPHSTFQLVKSLGVDLPGAISATALGEPGVSTSSMMPTYDLLDEVALADRLRSLDQQPLGADPDGIRLSLAGAQSKTAVYVTQEGQIAWSKDGYPTSHIIKPALRPELPGVALLEYFFMRLAKTVGLDTPEVTYGRAQEIPYVMIERYDRTRDDMGRITRLHQEDFCQALGIAASNKYQSRGGPGLTQCFELANRLDVPARARLALRDLVLFNWLIGNHDAHGKNFSVLYTEDGPTLAPAYDLVSVLLYEHAASRETDPLKRWNRKMAMYIGGAQEGRDVTPKHWQRFAQDVGMRWPAIRRRIDELSKDVVIEAIRLETALHQVAVRDEVLRRAITMLIDHVQQLRVAQGLGSVQDLPARPSATVDALTEMVTEASRHEYLAAYRRVMTRIATEHRRARAIGDKEQDAQLGTLGRDLTQAIRAWELGAELTEAQVLLLTEQVGEIPGH